MVAAHWTVTALLTPWIQIVHAFVHNGHRTEDSHRRSVRSCLDQWGMGLVDTVLVRTIEGLNQQLAIQDDQAGRPEYQQRRTRVAVVAVAAVKS